MSNTDNNVIHEAFDRLEAEAKKIIDDLRFRIKQALHPTNHDPVDAHTNAADDSLSAAIDAARQAASGDVAVAAGTEATEGQPAAGSADTGVGASTTANSGLVGGAASANPTEAGTQSKDSSTTDQNTQDGQKHQTAGEADPNAGTKA
jgi:hypothetical protein